MLHLAFQQFAYKKKYTDFKMCGAAIIQKFDGSIPN